MQRRTCSPRPRRSVPFLGVRRLGVRCLDELRSARGVASAVLIREEPATELTVATRILAHAGALAADGRVALVTGEVVYTAGRGISPHTMTPYDVVAVRLGDGTPLWGEPPADVERYLAAFRTVPGAGAAAAAADGTLLTAPTVRDCVAQLLRRPWLEAEMSARSAGALIGAYPSGDES